MPKLHLSICLPLFFVFSLFSLPAVNAQTVVTSNVGYPIGTAMNSVGYGNSVYVAVGNNGDLLTSSDGMKWVIAQSGATFLNTSWKKVTYGNSLFVAVSADGYIATSPDGTTWTQRTSAGATALYSVLYAGSQFVAVGNAMVLTSADGITWASSTVGAASDLFLNLVYSGGKYVIGSRDGATTGSAVFYSTTGASGSWTKVTVSSNGANSLNSIAALNGVFYVFTSSSAIFTSSNASTWTALSAANLASPTQMFDGFYAGSTYYLFGSTSAYGYGSVFTSSDGSTWTLQAKSTSITTQGAAYVNGMYFQVGNEGLVFSTNGSNWAFPAGSYFGVVINGSTSVAVGQTAAADAGIFTSPDWTTFTNHSIGGNGLLTGVTYGNGKYVAVGNVNSSTFGALATSSDGVTWTGGNTGIVQNVRAVAYGNSKYVAVGINGGIIYSSNGTSWTSAESVTGYNYNGVAYLNSYFIAVGGSTTANTGMAKVKYSADGVTWTDVSPSVVGQFHSITYGGGKYLLVGRDNTTGSLKFISITTTDITNASGWSATSAAVTPAVNIGTSGYGGVAYGNGQYVAIGNLNATPFTAYALSSTDGINWTATSANTTARLRGIVYNSSNVFKAVGLTDTKLSITAGTPLPLTLLSFTARLIDNKTLLSWETSNEVDTKDFNIEFSTDGTSFGQIGSVAAAGSSSAVLHYTFTHDQPLPGNNFYRLRMVDIDGLFTYSRVEKITVAAGSGAIALFPNPVAGSQLYISVPAVVSLPLGYTIYDASGRMVRQGKLTQRTQALDMQSFNKGNYSILFSNGLSQKIMRL